VRNRKLVAGGRAVPVKKVYIAAISPRGDDTPVDEGGVVTLTQLSDDGVACVAVVDGSRRAPQVEVIVADVDNAATGTGKSTSGFRCSRRVKCLRDTGSARGVFCSHSPAGSTIDMPLSNCHYRGTYRCRCAIPC